MALNNIEIFQNMVPHFLHAVERMCTSNWKINEGIIMNHNIILVYDGEAAIGCNGKEYHVSRGNLIYFKPGDLRYGKIYSLNPMKCFAVDFHFVCPFFSNETWQMESADLPFDTIGHIHDTRLLSKLVDLFSEFVDFWISGKPSLSIRCRSVFLELVNLLLQCEAGNSMNFDKIRKTEKLIQYMLEHYKRHISLKELCDVLNISPSYLGTIFKEVTGNTPIEYLLDIRMKKAKSLLVSGSSVTETSRLVGFNDIFYFSKYFKKLEGISPSEFIQDWQNV